MEYHRRRVQSISTKTVTEFRNSSEVGNYFGVRRGERVQEGDGKTSTFVTMSSRGEKKKAAAATAAAEEE